MLEIHPLFGKVDEFHALLIGQIPQNVDDIIEIDTIARMNALNLIKRKFYKF